MPVYTTSEKTDMMMVLGEMHGNSRDAARVYRLRYPHRRHPDASSIWRLRRNLAAHGSFRKPSVPAPQQQVRRENLAQCVLAWMYANPHDSSANVAVAMNISQRTVLRILHRYQFHPYRIHLHQALHGDDGMHRVDFCMHMRDMIQQDPQLVQHILFSDEATFHRDGTVNRHNLHYWAKENPHWLRLDTHQQRWKLNVWCGVFNDRIIGPYFIPGNLTGPAYLHLLRVTVSDDFLDHLPLATRRRVWFQQDGCPPHNAQDVRTWLNDHFGDQWMGTTGPVRWPARSPDLTPLDFFLWGFVKSHVYATPPADLIDLQTRIRQALGLITPEMLRLVRQGFVQRLDDCVAADGWHFEHLA